jgi:DUF4097 and DUF4098 domain-containing protein YvlB
MEARLILAFALISWGVQEQQAPQKPPEAPSAPYVERDQRQFNFYPGGKLQIVTGVPGNVKIIGWGRAAVMLQLERIVYHLTQEQAQRLASQYPVQLRWSQTSATIRTNGPPQSAATMEMNLTIYVPKEKTDINAQLLQGDLAVGAVNGWVEGNLNEGNIEAKSLSGYFSAVTKRGDINVEMDGKRWRGHEFSAVTQKGSVSLVLPVDYSTALLLETKDGSIQIQYPAQTVDGESIPLLAVAKNKASSLAATLGQGGAPVKLHTTSGDVKLAAK